ncbi:CHASE domain-containing protein [Aquabacterium sp.]|uniref:CHASE domain-containing protein n=1 Tax=Aquabacterium sp. TaxID=1872578 RepID=UPI002489CF41|nr:CHASE domain-containing protein [Aquabacterium sp.]MDI1261414.1 CHASE domain-containing protein [Aquabacterium sp.]
MKPNLNPIRLLAEVIAIVALTSAIIALGLPLLGLDDAASISPLLGTSLLVLLASPTVYWRCMVAARRPLLAAAPQLARSTGGGGVRLAVAMTAAAQLLGLAATAFAVVWQQHALGDAARTKFERGAERIEAEIKRRFVQPLFGMNGARAMYVGGVVIDAKGFRAYVEERSLATEFPGTHGFGFIQRVMRGDLDTFTTEMRAHGAPDFAVRSSGNAPDLYIIKHIEPLANNRAAWGFDIGQEAVRREAAERAISSGEPALTGRITLVQDGNQGPGLLLLMPVFQRGADTTTPQQRQNTLVGLLYTPIVVAELMHGVTEAADRSLDFELFDDDATQSRQLLFDLDDHLHKVGAHGTLTAADFAVRQFDSLRTFKVGGRTLALRIRTTPAFDDAIDRSNVAVIAVVGALASLLMALTVWLLAVGRVRAQNQARRMTADLDRLARVAQYTSNAVIITDAALRITWVNEGFTRITGYTLAEAEGHTPGALLGSDKADPATIKILRDAAAAGSACRVEVLNCAKDGRDFWVDTEVQPTRDDRGALLGFMEIATDITARRALESEAGRAQAVLRGSIEAIDEAFVLYDPDDRLVLCNHKYRQLYRGVAHLMVPGARFEDIVRAGAQRGDYTAAVGRVEEWVAERVAAHQGANSTVIQHLSDGRTLRIVERRTPDGHIVGFRVDITALVKATEAAEAASRSKSQFLANMSHEIRTPMNAILGMLKLLQNTTLNARQLDYTSKTEGAAHSLLGLLNDILDFSKIDAGKMTLDPRPFRPDRLLRDLSVILSSNVGTKNIEVLYDIDPALPRGLLGDDMRLQQVLINLGGNAIKFTSAGQVVLRLRALELTEHDVLLGVAVRDSGIGIAPEHQAHIFTGFSQAEASTTRRFGGTGLGLAICQRLVSMMGGELRLDSVLGQGSTFHFQLRLPLAEVAADEPQARPTPDMTALQTLIIDDNACARELLSDMVSSLGWQADVAASGTHAIALVEERAAARGAYQAVFVDWQMPGLDGWETSQRLRQMPGVAQSALIVMVSAHGRDMLAQRSAQEQAQLSGYLVKPVTATMLYDAVADARIALTHPELVIQPMATKTLRLAGMRLLVVEDNLNNQQVAQELLEDEGASVTLADNGELGVAAVAAANPPFDAVLMDLQMPVMDGYTAAGCIRQDLRRTDLPIIAMTANAMASDREACLTAGMNDHVGKPFDLNHLVSTLQRWTRRVGTPMGARAMAATDLSDELLAEASRNGIDLAAALQRMGGNLGAYQRLLGSVAKDLAAWPEQFDTLLHQQERVESSHLMHTIKGLAATLGLTRLASVAAEAERALLRPEAPNEHAALADALRSAAATALPAITRLSEALQETTHAPVNPTISSAEDLRKAVRELTDLLRSADMRAINVFEQLQQNHAPRLETALQPLADAMAMLDFKRALALCEALTAAVAK